MNRDLDNLLHEMGPEYRTMVSAMTRAFDKSEVRSPLSVRWAAAGIAAAAVLLLLGIAFVFRGEPERVYTVKASSVANEYLLATIRNDEAVKEMIRTQKTDGGWRNDFLTRQNAAALRLCSSAEAKIAYKKAVRNLRSKGAL